MDTKTLEALKQSHEKWLANVKAEKLEEVQIGADECPLCSLFLLTYRCMGCPIRERTGEHGCIGTPYYDASGKLRNWLDANGKGAEAKFRAAAQEMADFLGDVLNEYESETKQENVKHQERGCEAKGKIHERRCVIMLTPNTTKIQLYDGKIQTVHYNPAGKEGWNIDVWIGYDSVGDAVVWEADGTCLYDDHKAIKVLEENKNGKN